MKARSNDTRRRSAAVTVEMAVIMPVLILFLFGLIVGGLGVYRSTEVARVARTASRYASMHGAQYSRETGNPAATPEDIYNNAIINKSVLLRPENLSYTVTWDNSNEPQEIINGDVQNPKTNTVTVTITYQWVPEVPFLGPVTLSSTSTVPMYH